MKQLKFIFSGIILVVSLILLFDKLFTPQPIQIYLSSGQVITAETADYFSLTETLLFIVCAFLIGMTSTYLFYSDTFVSRGSLGEKDSQVSKLGKGERQNVSNVSSAINKYDVILSLLKEDEAKVFHFLKQENTIVYQNKLARHLDLSKVKMTRILSRLEKKNLIVRERAGMTNIIKLK